MAIGLMRKGFQETLQDATAGADDNAGAITERLEKLLSGEYAFGGGGGKRLTELERALREVVKAVLKKAGVKGSDAEKYATDPEAAIKSATEKKGNFVEVWAKITARAEKMVAERKSNAIEL